MVVVVAGGGSGFSLGTENNGMLIGEKRYVSSESVVEGFLCNLQVE